MIHFELITQNLNHIIIKLILLSKNSNFYYIYNLLSTQKWQNDHIRLISKPYSNTFIYTEKKNNYKIDIKRKKIYPKLRPINRRLIDREALKATIIIFTPHHLCFTPITPLRGNRSSIQYEIRRCSAGRSAESMEIDVAAARLISITGRGRGGGGPRSDG